MDPPPNPPTSYTYTNGAGLLFSSRTVTVTSPKAGASGPTTFNVVVLPAVTVTDSVVEKPLRSSRETS